MAGAMDLRHLSLRVDRYLTMIPGERRITAPHISEGGVVVHAERCTRSYAKQHTNATGKRGRMEPIRVYQEVLQYIAVQRGRWGDEVDSQPCRTNTGTLVLRSQTNVKHVLI